MGLTGLSSERSTHKLVSALSMLKLAGEIVAIKKMKKKYYRWEQCISQKEI